MEKYEFTISEAVDRFCEVKPHLEMTYTLGLWKRFYNSGFFDVIGRDGDGRTSAVILSGPSYFKGALFSRLVGDGFDREKLSSVDAFMRSSRYANHREHNPKSILDQPRTSFIEDAVRGVEAGEPWLVEIEREGETVECRPRWPHLPSEYDPIDDEVLKLGRAHGFLVKRPEAESFLTVVLNRTFEPLL